MLVDRGGIIARKMLALGATEVLRRYGDRIHVHLTMKTAPRTQRAEMDRVKAGITDNLEGAELDDKTFHGQLRFSVLARSNSSATEEKFLVDNKFHQGQMSRRRNSDSAIGMLFRTLKAKKEPLGFEYYSVSRTSLHEVFLNIVE